MVRLPSGVRRTALRQSRSCSVLLFTHKTEQEGLAPPYYCVVVDIVERMFVKKWCLFLNVRLLCTVHPRGKKRKLHDKNNNILYGVIVDDTLRAV